jgi:hypothetical protein
VRTEAVPVSFYLLLFAPLFGIVFDEFFDGFSDQIPYRTVLDFGNLFKLGFHELVYPNAQLLAGILGHGATLTAQHMSCQEQNEGAHHGLCDAKPKANRLI